MSTVSWHTSLLMVKYQWNKLLISCQEMPPHTLIHWSFQFTILTPWNNLVTVQVIEKVLSRPVSIPSFFALPVTCYALQYLQKFQISDLKTILYSSPMELCTRSIMPFMPPSCHPCVKWINSWYSNFGKLLLSTHTIQALDVVCSSSYSEMFRLDGKLPSFSSFSISSIY